MVVIATTFLIASGLPAAQGQSAMRIAAVVNDEVISVDDLVSRIALLLATSGIADTPESRQRVAGHVLRQLIEETLKLQEARRAGIDVGESEIDRALIDISSQLGLSPDQLAPALASRGVRVQSLISQVRSEIAWAKTVAARAEGRTDVTEEDVRVRIDQLAADAGKPEYRVAEIYLGIDDPRRTTEVEALANRLMSQLRAGVPFPNLARSFSESGSASLGGDLGWIRPEQLASELREVIAGLQPGEAFGPVRTGDGFSIILMIDARQIPPIDRGEIVVSLQQLVLGLPSQPTAEILEEQMNRARSLAAGAQSCEALDEIGRTVGSPLSGSLGTKALDTLDADLQRLIRPLRPGEITPPFRSESDIIVLMVCDRSEDNVDPELLERVRASLVREKLELAARRLLRDLQRDAYVDVRI